MELKDFSTSDYLFEIQSIDQSNLSLRNKYIRLKRILERSCKELTEGDSLQFPSLFSRIVFIAQQYDLPKAMEWQLQNVRIKAAFLLRNEQNLVSPNQYQRAKNVLEGFFLLLKGDRTKEIPDEEVLPKSDSLFWEKIRVEVEEVDEEKELILCRCELFPDEEIKVKYNVEDVNSVFNDTVHHLWRGAQLNLLDVKVGKEGIFVPKIVVLEPDYLIDASSIAECFQSYGSSHYHYLRRKLEPNTSSKHILLGNLANFFLDELIYADDIDNLTFKEVFMKSFQFMPFEYASCADIAENSDFKEFMTKAESQFQNIKRVVQHDLQVNNFDASLCLLEPSFFCEKYGFQGRLDLLQLTSEERQDSRIIELKSGKTPFPQDDATKIAPNHVTQTAVYRLMIQTVFNTNIRHIYPYILYSSAENKGENLRYSAGFQRLEKEIINTRNQIVAVERSLYAGDVVAVETIFDQLFNLDNYGRVPQFFTDKLVAIKKVLDSATSLEKSYFYRYVSFISRELYLQKTGDESYDSSMSISALWNSAFAERKEALELIENLSIRQIDDSGRGMVIYFDRKDTLECVNFREGEICILYPRQSEDDSVLTNQILKGTVVEVSANQVVLRFRYKQRNKQFFARYKYWAVEHDKLDHGYNAMFKSLFAFLSASVDKKELILGLREPQSSLLSIQKGAETKEEKQKQVIDKATAADDYFLIVGPPGTGKTSIFAKQLIERFYSDEKVNILVMAYTNRAVDELCSAISAAFGEEEMECNKYIRIGSELSCGEASRHRLLQNLSGNVESRRDLLQFIKDTRIFVGTLASIVGKPELFELKKFNVAIIDEASQILEPQIVGLLPHFDKFIMIGDHKQLSTITLQDETKSKVNEPNLNRIELYDCRESLFERLFRICQQNKWTHAYDTLTYHGRMHKDIARLVNDVFYDGELKVATERQSEQLDFVAFDEADRLQQMLATSRVQFIPVRNADYTNVSDKINNEEADIVVALVKAQIEVYNKNGKVFDPQKSLGIITPYRNQIATIKHKLEEAGVPEFEKIMIDTVERFQGSQRDTIILSFCFNKPYQLYAFCNLNREKTVDRKLNVALTRARGQLIMVGNDYILRQHPIYRNLLEQVERINKSM